MIITYYGDGKGKTTAALGLALRASGAGRRVKIIQFIKGKWKSGEEAAIKKIAGMSIEKAGIGFVGIAGDKHSRSEHINAARGGLEAARKAVANPKYDIIILDEINWAISEHLITINSVLELMRSLSSQKTIILTGVPKINEFIECSDLVTEMKKIKHPYDQDIMAKEGIDY
jgi:cob(I)alamin adenosyltransferase